MTFEKIEVPSAEGLKSKRINSWAQQLLDMKVNGAADELLDELKDQFADISKEDLLKRLITDQLNQLSSSTGEAANLNDSRTESRGQRESRPKNRQERRSWKSFY